MEEYFIEATVDTPEVILSKTSNILKFSGRSFPENTPHFYEPVIKWIEEYTQSTNATTQIEMRFSYFNTSSSKQLLKILSILTNRKKKDTKIIWYYENEDIDMLSTGKLFSQLLETNFDFIAS